MIWLKYQKFLSVCLLVFLSNSFLKDFGFCDLAIYSCKFVCEFISCWLPFLYLTQRCLSLLLPLSNFHHYQDKFCVFITIIPNSQQKHTHTHNSHHISLTLWNVSGCLWYCFLCLLFAIQPSNLTRAAYV